MGSLSRAKIDNFTPRRVGLFFFFLFFAALIVSRRVDCVQNPQFWAEEGSRFFVEALERPFWINLVSYSYGYFDLLIRLTQQIATLVPLDYAPVVLVLSAILVQTAVPTFIISSRCAEWMGPFPIRLVAAILYCGMPNSFEVHCIPLHSRVHLVVLAALVIISTPARSFLGRVFDYATLICGGLSGPFVLLLAPVAAWCYWRTPNPVTRRNCLILAIALAFTTLALINSVGTRFATSLGASLWEGVRIIGGQFVMGFLLGQKSYEAIVHAPYFDIAASLSFLSLSILLFLIARREKSEVRVLLFIGIGALAIALAAPIGGAPGKTQWNALWSIPGNGQRYYFLPMAMLLFAIAAVAGRGCGRTWRAVAASLLLLIAIVGVRVDWKLPAFTDFHFRRYVDLYRSRAPGASVIVPINPPGWEMELKKPKPQ
jgi:hypothetical protein